MAGEQNGGVAGDSPAAGPVVGFVGLGNMGRPMADRVVAAGFELVGYDRAGSAERCPEGARPASDLGDVAAAAELVLVSVPDGAASLAVATGLAALPADQRRVAAVVDLSTIGPEAAAQAAAVLGAAGIAYADGPVSGGTSGARAGTVSLMFSGPADVANRYRPVLAAISSNVFPVGDRPGQGQAMKLVNNVLSATALAAAAEALAFGRSQGLDLALMLDVLNVSSGRSSATDDKFPNRVVTGTYDAGFTTTLMAKDVSLLAAEAARAGTRRELIEAVVARWRAVDDDLAGVDFTRIWPWTLGIPEFEEPGPH